MKLRRTKQAQRGRVAVKPEHPISDACCAKSLAGVKLKKIRAVGKEKAFCLDMREFQNG
jgi:hypothetical protein